METMKALLERKSVRGYLDREVEKEKLSAVVEAGRRAPNAGPIHLTVVRDGAFLREIDAAALEALKNSGNDFLVSRANLPGYHPLYGAPVLVLLSAPKEGYGQVNTACAAAVMTVAAADQGLGSCYVVSPILALDGKNALSKRLALPEGYVPMCGVILGYPGEDKFSHPRELADNVTYM